MRRGGDTFPGAGPGRRSTVARNASSRAALDQDLDSILSGGNDDDIFGTSAQQQPKAKGQSGTSGFAKKGTLTSGATDEDFYSSLAQMAGSDIDDEDESLSETDAKKMADSLAGLDDMESDLFGGSLGKKSTPSKPPKPVKATSEQKRISTDNKLPPGTSPVTESAKSKIESVSSSSSTKTGEASEKATSKQDSVKVKEVKKPRKKFDFGEFDEDDPLAGLLSDEDEDPKPKPKPRKSTASKSTGSSALSSQVSTEERPTSSRGRRPANQESANTPSPPVTPEHQPAVRGSKDQGETVSSPPGSPGITPDKEEGDVTPSQTAPRNKGQRKPAAGKAKPSKEEINFDSDEDLPGLDDSKENTPRDSPTPPARSKKEQTSKRKTQYPPGDIFGDDDDLPATETRSDSPTQGSRFSELLGKKEKEETKKQVPKSLDDFMANISTKPPAGGGTTSKKVSSPTSEDSFQFGGYMPSAASSGRSRGRGGLARPDTAPSSTKRSVRFSDDLGLDDELFGSERPSTAPSQRSPRKQTKREDRDENINGSYSDDRDQKPKEDSKPTRGQAKISEETMIEQKKNPQTEKPKDNSTPATHGSKSSGGGGGDWLGLSGGDDDGGLDPSSAPPKTSTSFPQESRKDTPSKQVPTERQERQQSPPGRAGRRRGDGDSDEFLRMLGITPDEPPKPTPKQVESADDSGKSSLFPWESPGGSPRRGRRWRNQSSPQSSFDEPDPASTLGGPLDRPHQGGPLEKDDFEKSKMQETRQQSINQHTTKLQIEQQPAAAEIQTRRESQTAAIHDSSSPAAAVPQAQVPPPASRPQQPGPRFPQQYSLQSYTTQPIPHETNVPLQVTAQPSAKQVYPLHQHLSASQVQTTPFTSPTGQNVSQTLSYQPHYQSPAGFQPSPQVVQPSSVERLEMSKLKAESELQQNRLLEYELVNEQHVQQKTRLEEEVKELMKKVQERENVRQRTDLDASSKLSELEGKVRRYELEREQLLTTIEALKTRHKDELANIDASHKSHLKTLEESYHRREQRLQDETDLIIKQNSEKLKTLETEKADIRAASNRKLSTLETAKNNEIETLKDLHRRAMEQLRHEHEDEMAHFRRLKEQEVSAATSAHAHTKSLQSLMDQVLNSTREVSDLRQKIEVTHKSGLEERELSARARDEYLKQLQERLLRQQSENDEERTRLQGLVAKMELHMREQSRQVDQERWRLSQDESRMKAVQAALEDERRITMEQLSLQRAEIQRARDDLVREQRTAMSQIQEERRSLATERAQLSSAHRDLISREKLKTETSVQAEADLGATAVKIKEDAAALNVREAQLKQEEERMRREKEELERKRIGFQEERDRVGRLGLEVQKRSREIEELCTDAGRARNEGEQALELAERVRVNAEAQRAEAEGMFLVVQEKERQLAQDRLAIAHERRMLEKDKQSGRCWQCEGRRTSPAEQIHASQVSVSPAMDSSVHTHLSLPMSVPGTPDLLVNTLELKRTLRKWSHDKEKDEEFLEQEAQFLNRLQKSRDTSKRCSY
ncbi:fas-binding factor 1 homolog isoform X3 [Stylophora pistillata]|uniref:fas-binding factor 1 homolog isoform X3 n=1 Tax=Stylophora pistillata TaxID=50429 RepID=UPI000C04BEFB|nr:fas-binding factor 1 homolog isoform X3 [Stylophora pistillata]